MSEKGPENLGNENLEEDDDDISKDDTELEEPDPNDPVEILQKGREKIKSSNTVQELKEELKGLKMTARFLSKEIEEGVSADSNIHKQLDRNENRQREIAEQIQAIEDRIKKQMTDATKRRRDRMEKP